MNYEGLIPILGGIYALLMVYGFISVGKSESAVFEWKQKYGIMLKILSPLLIVFGFLMLFRIL